MTLQQLVLWRHAQSEDNAAGVLQGQRDSPLTKTGWEQARLAVPILARFDPQIIVASDLQRAVNTAQVFTEVFPVPLRVDKRLREVNLGLMQGLTPGEIGRRWPGELAEWRADPTRESPQGESKIEAAAR